jgi:hypothetical protein
MSLTPRSPLSPVIATDAQDQSFWTGQTAALGLSAAQAQAQAHVQALVRTFVPPEHRHKADLEDIGRWFVVGGLVLYAIWLLASGVIRCKHAFTSSRLQTEDSHGRHVSATKHKHIQSGYCSASTDEDEEERAGQMRCAVESADADIMEDSAHGDVTQDAYADACEELSSEGLSATMTIRTIFDNTTMGLDNLRAHLRSIGGPPDDDPFELGSTVSCVSNDDDPLRVSKAEKETLSGTAAQVAEVYVLSLVDVEWCRL